MHKVGNVKKKIMLSLQVGIVISIVFSLSAFAVESKKSGGNYVSTPDDRKTEELITQYKMGAQVEDSRSTEELLAPALEAQEKEAREAEKALAKAEKEEAEKQTKFDSTGANTEHSVTDYALDTSELHLQNGWYEDPISGNWYYVMSSGEIATDYMLYYQGETYYFDERGKRIQDEIVEYKGEKYYFDQNGIMGKNRWVMTNKKDEDDGGVEIVRYYFGSNGRAYRAAGSQSFIIKVVEDERYAFDQNGEVLHGYLDEYGNELDEKQENAYENAMYYFGTQTEPQMVTGWLAYDGNKDEDRYKDNELYLYFSPQTGRKYRANSDEYDYGFKTGKGRVCTIDGCTYRFDENGIMRSGWVKGDGLSPQHEANKKYFSYDYEGWMMEGWFTAVPPENCTLKKNKEYHDSDDEQWFYADSRGYVLRNQIRKIGNNYFCFDADGVMQKEVVVVVDSTGKPHDRPTGLSDDNPYPFVPISKVTKSMLFRYTDTSEEDYLMLQDGDKIKIFVENEGEDDLTTVDGQMVYGSSTKKLTIKDDDIQFKSGINGSFSSQIVADAVRGSDGKMYQNGVLLKCDKTDKYGIIREADHLYTVVDKYGKTAAYSNTNITYMCKKLGTDKYIVFNKLGEYIGCYTKEIRVYNGYMQYKDDSESNKNWRYFTSSGPEGDDTGEKIAFKTFTDPSSTEANEILKLYETFFAADTSLYINFKSYPVDGPAPSDRGKS